MPINSPLKVLVVLNGDGLNTTGLSGGAVRTYEVLRSWAAEGKALPHAITTSGGLHKLSAFGLDRPAHMVKSSFFGTRERFAFYRFASYLISTIHFRFKEPETPPAEVVISSSDFFCDTEVAILLKKRRTKIRWIAMVYHLYTKPWKRPGNPLVNWIWFILQRWSLRRIARWADGVMVHDTEEGDLVKNLLVRLGMSAAVVHPMRNGVHLRRFDQPKTTGKPEFTALFVGELRPNKGVFDLIPIWRNVCSSVPEARLLVVGGGNQHICNRLTAAIQAAGLKDRILLAGSLSQEDLVKAYHSTQLFISPSHEEGWGIAICEAMAAGVPVVAYDLPVYRRHYHNAFEAAPCFNRSTFAECIVKLLKDASRRKDLISIGGERSRSYDWNLLAGRDWDFVRQRLP